MKKINRLNIGDTVAIVALSNGLLNQEFQIKKIRKKLKKFGFESSIPNKC